MPLALFLEQTLNGLQQGVMLFLMAAGLTLIFGIMHLINLAHGSLYMVGAYVAATVTSLTGNFLLGVLAALGAAGATGMLVELLALRRLYGRDHLDQVLATFGIILTFNEITKILWGPQALFLSTPEVLSSTVEVIPGVPYPAYRLFVIIVGLAVCFFLRHLIINTRLGMLIRAGATHREMVNALGVNIDRLFTIVFGIGAMLAGLAGAMAGPMLAIEVGMGENILILTFVVIIIGGIGSIRGALIGAILVGMVDTYGRAFLPLIMRSFMEPSAADTVGASVSSVAIYVLMAVVLIWRPRGLFQAYGG
ncbi:MAG: branched-chain amino acid ABC transporter permease [Rhodospirillales bacterium]|jgi:branched-chain amino acid transport system permease protein|nr:branched-chain amino acid ABC transporter permease [Rhodospirillales bacterium]MBT4625292.1 branched-chain amino acid ABC transporter permease [Rhodospirillales bacterium]MBT5352565.1 branched-chain amino acid ABC transporter permease [Rhodospirillales bacterium]MBT5520905.1 branched-chain amino acid ABC transporter permease [Rhodospirillales bacterium]MBT6111913.1 branched-chain amino acid ABC transporter permease [Rhodospirillales bacterium]